MENVKELEFEIIKAEYLRDFTDDSRILTPSNIKELGFKQAKNNEK